MSLQLIKDYKDLARDSETGAIVNINDNAYQASLEQHKRAAKEKEQLEKNTNDINSIKMDLTEIKTMLETVLKKGKINDGR